MQKNLASNYVPPERGIAVQTRTPKSTQIMLVGVGGGVVWLVLRFSSDGDGRMPGGKNQTPKKSHAHAKFPSLENFQKKLNDITQQNLQIVLPKKKPT